MLDARVGDEVKAGVDKSHISQLASSPRANDSYWSIVKAEGENQVVANTLLSNEDDGYPGTPLFKQTAGIVGIL